MKKIIAEKPWEYTLYQVDNSRLIVSIPYSPKSYVDALMNIELTQEEVELFDKDSKWISSFAEKVRYSPDQYLSRELPKNI